MEKRLRSSSGAVTLRVEAHGALVPVAGIAAVGVGDAGPGAPLHHGDLAVVAAVAAAAVLVFLVSWSQYLLTLLAGGGRVVTVTMLLFNALAGGNPSSIGSLALVAAAPSVLALAVAAVGLREPARS